ITVSYHKETFSFHTSVGGLASGINSYLDRMRTASSSNDDFLWIGWPGMTVEDDRQNELTEQLEQNYQAHPIFIQDEMMKSFYEGFCNKTIWPLFHYFPSFCSFDETSWENYKTVNQMYCDAILKVIKPDDTIWIHDYHLMLLPSLIRKERPNAKIGFFLHIPFPSFELFRLMPHAWRTEILRGMLGANVVGFHTPDFVQDFLRCTLRILGWEHNSGWLTVQDRLVLIDTFPMGIDFQRFFSAASAPEVKKEKALLQQTLGEQKVILSLDRLDYSKGILQRLAGFEHFLREHPEWHKKLVLLLVLVPSRIGVDRYQEMKDQIDAAVGKINGAFGSFDWVPIVYQTRFVEFAGLSALYQQSHIALITPLRDGMNLVAKEYVASRSDQTGVLILSEMAGAAHELGEAIIINPHTREEISRALERALNMPEEEQKQHNAVMQKRLQKYDIVGWVEDFMRSMHHAEEEQHHFRAKILTSDKLTAIKNHFVSAQRKLLLLDYDGTLVSFHPSRDKAAPPQALMDLLRKLSTLAEVVIISGRHRNTLGHWLGDLSVHLVAEHGAWYKKRNQTWELFKPLRNDWKNNLLPIMQLFADRLPGAEVEEKEYCLVWHYVGADPELASRRRKELLDHLMNFTANMDVQILQGRKIIEVRNAGVTKGNVVQELFPFSDYDFVLSMGDDTTDEDLFRILPENAVSIRVGLTNTFAKWNVVDTQAALHLLASFVD
ncbi:MAG: bifunctional alpha,alpha-trehalose-phosphate synthase (UDP-forming)/trehalose-phosphatase, partial [Deltaproteobacteria bacterium]|nr:bifunctional alpha,alpha-trehalose-phosphate synthase (UDP-forming)/trehalose-phosphatase [Deltaproteobacteria bacterium]